MRPPRGPMRAGAGRARPPRQRSSAGPLAFLLVIAVVLGGVLFIGRGVAENAIVAAAADRDTLLRQPLVRALVGPRVAADIDRAADPAGAQRNFVVERGETAAMIAARLEAEGVVRSSLAFKYVLYESGRESALQSGSYRVSPSMTPREIARLFERAPGEQAVLRIIEGWRLTEIAAAVQKAFPNITAQQFVAAAVVGDRKYSVLAGLDPRTPLEGFLFPDTYFFRTDATAPQIIDALLETFEKRAGERLRIGAAQQKTTVYALITLASLVEREARDRNESAAIAGVYANRLRIGMKLDADPTIQYALGDWRELTLADLRIDSPYNTYRVAGLPPTPICNPGRAALEGAAAPAEVPFFYFVAKSDGSGGHAFARTLEEHEANRVKFGNR